MTTANLRRLAGEAWSFRASVEHDAAVRFQRLATVLAALDPDSAVIALFRRASNDEQRHATLCAELAASYRIQGIGCAVPPSEIAPVGLTPREALLYEAVAACCITETESVATLTTLLAERGEPRVRSVLHEIAKDEVIHGQMGWAHLASEARRSEVSFLSAWIPRMLAGTIENDFFTRGAGNAEGDELLRHGVLPIARKREVFSRTLRQVVFPGLERFGVDASPGRAWLEKSERGGA